MSQAAEIHEPILLAPQVLGLTQGPVLDRAMPRKAAGAGAKKPPRKRTALQKARRSKRDRIQRQVGSLPKHHGWLISKAATAQEASELSARLADQESAGLEQLTAKVLGRGTTPTECLPEVKNWKPNVDLAQVSSYILYQRLCELEALREQVMAEMVPIFNALVSRDYLEPLRDIDSSSDNDETCVENFKVKSG